MLDGGSAHRVRAELDLTGGGWYAGHVNKHEYDALALLLRTDGPDIVDSVRPEELTDQSDRILVYGYTTNRDTFSVSLEGGHFVGRCYGSDQRENPPVAWRSKSPSEERLATILVPNKRIYPDRSDAEFLTMLFQRGAYVSLANWKD